MTSPGGAVPRDDELLTGRLDALTSPGFWLIVLPVGLLVFWLQHRSTRAEDAPRRGWRGNGRELLDVIVLVIAIGGAYALAHAVGLA